MSERGQESSGVLEGTENNNNQSDQQDSQQDNQQQNDDQNQEQQLQNPQQQSQTAVQKVQVEKQPFKLLPRGYGFNPLILVLAFSVYFFIVAIINFALILNEYPQLYIPGIFNYVSVQKLSDMQFDQQKFNITGQYYSLDANGQLQLQRTTYTNISGVFDQANQNWYLTSLLIPFRVNTDTTYNISIQYGFPTRPANSLEIIIPNQLLQNTQQFVLLRPKTIILQAQESFNQSYLSYNGLGSSQTQNNQYFVGIQSVDIRIFYRDSRKIKLFTDGVNQNYAKFQSALGMLIVGFFLFFLSLFLLMYGFSRIGQQMIVTRMYAKAKEGGSSYLNLRRPNFEPSGALWRRYNRGNGEDAVNRYPPLLYE